MFIEQSTFQHILQKKFLDIQSRNASYTMRSYAQKLDMSSGALSEILNGKRKVSEKLATKVADLLALDPTERSEIFAEPKSSNKKKSPQADLLRLTADQFSMLSEWYHFAILSLMNMKGFRSESVWIAQRLNVPAPKIADAIGRMLRLGLLEYDKRGELVQTKKALRTTDDIADMSIRKSHHGDLELVRKSIDQIETANRDLSSINLPLDPAKLKQAKELIRDFQDKMLDLVWTENSSEVYKMSVYLYPLTKKSEGEK